MASRSDNVWLQFCTTLSARTLSHFKGGISIPAMRHRRATPNMRAPCNSTAHTKRQLYVVGPLAASIGQCMESAWSGCANATTTACKRSLFHSWPVQKGGAGQRRYVWCQHGSFFPSVMLVSPLLFSLGSRLFACCLVPTHHLLCVLHVSYHVPLVPIYPPHIDWLWPIFGIWWYLSHGTRTCDTPVMWQMPLIGPRQDEGKPPAVRRGQLQPSPGGRRRSHRSQRCRKGVFVCMHALGNGNMI